MAKSPSTRNGRTGAKRAPRQSGSARTTRSSRTSAAKPSYPASPFGFPDFANMDPASILGMQPPQIPAFMLRPLQLWFFWYLQMMWEIAHAQAAFMSRHADMMTSFASERRDFYADMQSEEGRGDDEDEGNIEEWNKAYRDWMTSAFSASAPGAPGPFSPFSGAPGGQGGSSASSSRGAGSAPATATGEAAGS